MDAEFPQSDQEAEAHIHQIRCEKGLGGRPGEIAHNAADLEAALELLSVDLYQTATHFLLELIQNADDNQYDQVLPTLRITHSLRRIRIDCNERGFSRRNVEAICRICKSTKSGRSKAAGFVGEKGIGFKAVFKVASTVIISSGHYQFKFNRHDHLGMIAPIWAPFPETVIPGWTSILLDLDDDCDESAIEQELRTYDARILLFLRRLQRLEINVDHPDRPRKWYDSTVRRGTTKDKSTNRENFSHVFTHQGRGYSSSNPSITSLGENDDVKDYLVWRHTAVKLPAEARRPGMSTSEIVLAFPLGKDGQTPEIAPQSVYAFLPIRQHGFDFLLHADFLLSTNREDILIDSPWNKALASAVSDAMVNAGVYMSNLPEGNYLRYAWMLYLPQKAPLNSLMMVIRWDLFEKLRHAPIMHTRQVGGKPRKPSDLTIVPDIYCDHKGVPFVQLSKNVEFVSGGYSWIYGDTKNSIFNDLCAKTMGEEDFMASMVSLLRKDPTSFYKGKTPEWHTSFCRTLHTILLAAIQNSGGKPMQTWVTTPIGDHMSKLPIIPLRGGGWATSYSATSIDVYYAETGSGAAQIPDGIQMRVVDPEAASNPDRRRLFDLLGVRNISGENIHNAIIVTHDSVTFKPGSVAPHVAVSHLAFLFQSGWSSNVSDISMAHDFWLASAQGQCYKSSSMYLPSKVPGAASLMLPPGGADKHYRFLHPLYMEGAVKIKDQDKWIEWILKHTQISVYPRLYNPEYPRHPLVHPDSKPFLENENQSLRLLTLLRDGWDYYKQFLDTSLKFPESRVQSHHVAGLNDIVQDIIVPCTGSALSAPLRSTYYMPSHSLPSPYRRLVPFLDLPDPENPAWGPLMEALKVEREPCLDFYLDCLRGCQNSSGVSTDTVRMLMGNIQNEAAAHLIKLRRAFSEENLVCIPAKEKGGKHIWVRSGKCIWKGEPWMTQYYVLNRYYPDLGALFQSSLLLPDANIHHVVDEAIAVPETEAAKRSTRRIEHILLALTSHIVENGNDGTTTTNSDAGLNPILKERLLDAKMFPIASEPRNQPFERFGSARAKDKDFWLIADRAIFRTQFRGILPVLSLDAEFVLKIMPLLVALGIRHRALSHVATNITEAHGQVTLLEGITAEYQRRSEFLFRLMPQGQPNQGQLRAKFRRVEVFSAETISQYWRAPLGLKQVQSIPTTGQAFLESDYFGDLRIYMPAKYETETYPFELAEQLREFFSIPVEHRDLILLILSAKMQRIEELFANRSIGPLLEESGNDDMFIFDVERSDLDYDASEENRSQDSGKKDKGTSRFGRILNRKRFHSSFFKEEDGFSDELPSYSAAVARTTQGATSSRTIEIGRKFPPTFTLPRLDNTIRDMDFQQKDGAIVGQPSRPPSLFSFIRGIAQRDVDTGEMIVSNALQKILGPQYNVDLTWMPRNKRKPGHSAFTFTDSQGRFGSFLMRLEGRTGKAQGYTKLTYHLDVKVSDEPQTGTFDLTQAELDKARQFSVHNEEESETEPRRHVSVLVHISNVRTEPKILFLVDPWDLFRAGQLVLETATKYRASLRLQTNEATTTGQEANDAGFDTVQFKSRGVAQAGPAYGKPPAYPDEKGKGVLREG